jgi:Protein of unknown function (DUF3105)
MALITKFRRAKKVMSRKARLKERQEAQQKQSMNQRTMLIAGVVVLVLLFAAFVAYRFNTTPLADIDLNAIPDASIVYPDLGREHIAVTDLHDPYNSNPPTSGPHASPVRTAVYTQELPDENLIHNLEHGHIWLSYRDRSDTELIDLLERIQANFPASVVVTYRPANDARLAVASWTRLLKLEEPDEQQILAFIARYFDKAPESVTGL